MAITNPTSTIAGNLHVNGTVSSRALQVPTGTITNSSIQANAGIDASKLQHLVRKTYGQAGTTTTHTVAFHVCRATGLILELAAGSKTKNLSGATVTVDLQNNGSSILVSPLELNDTHSAYEVVIGTIDSDDTDADDVLELVITATAGGGTLATGLFVTMDATEAYT